MQYEFSNRVQMLKPSAIREILKFSSQPGIISLAAGSPSSLALPTLEIAKISSELYSTKGVEALSYGVTEGYLPLIEWVKNYHVKLDEVKALDDIIITSGAQQVMMLAAHALCNEGDAIICENPSFIGSLNAFRALNINLVGVDIESDGMDIAQLEQALIKNKNVKFIYTIPNFQNPTAVTLSQKKRELMYDLACKYNVLILEDNPYGLLRFAGEDIPSIKSLDTDGRVIYAGTFSKTVSPGLRVGYTIAPSEIVSKMVVVKQVSDVHTNISGQMIVHKFITEFDYNKHIKNLKKIYKESAFVMMNKLDETLPEFTYYKAEGGMFIWCTLPKNVCMLDFCTLAVKNGVAVVPGVAFLCDTGANSRCIRLNFSAPSKEQIELGIEILAKTYYNNFTN